MLQRTGIAMAISGDAPGWLTGMAPKPAPKSPQQRKKLWELPTDGMTM